jgi:unspecific monooxygenase
MQSHTNDRTFQQNPKDPSFYNQPYSFYEQLHALDGPIYWREYELWCLKDFDSVNSALRDPRFARLPPPDLPQTSYGEHLAAFAQVEQFSLLALENPAHTRIRKSVNRAFANRRVQEMRSDIESIAHNLIDQFEAKSSVELLTVYAEPLPVAVIANLLGVPNEYCPQLLSWSHAMVRVYTMTQTTEEELLANNAAIEFQSLLRDLIKFKRRNPGSDLLSHLVSSQPDPLSDDEIVSTAVLLLNAGHEATVHQIGYAVNLILTNQIDTAWINDDTLADKVVDEAVRVDAPLHLFTRYAQESIQLHSKVSIDKGQQIALLLGAANRDPKRFEQPHLFNPQRTDGANVSFGAGTHFCIGTVLAKMEIRIALQTLFKRLPNLSLQHTPAYQNSYHFHGLETLPVRLK